MKNLLLISSALVFLLSCMWVPLNAHQGTATVTASETATETATETNTPKPTRTPSATPTATLDGPIKDMQTALMYMTPAEDTERMPNLDFCSESLNEEVVLAKHGDVVYAFSDTGCPYFRVQTDVGFQRIDPIGFIGHPVQLKNSVYQKRPWVFIVPEILGTYGVGWPNAKVLALGLFQVKLEKDKKDGDKTYWKITPPTATPTSTFTVTPTRTLRPTNTASSTPSRTPSRTPTFTQTVTTTPTP